VSWRIVLLSLLIFLLSPVAAAQTWTRYDCDTTPDLAVPAWVHESDGGFSVAAAGVLTVTGPDGAKELWRLDNPGFANSVGWTVEFRMRVVPENAEWEEEVEIIRIRDGAYNLRLFLGETSVGPDGWQTKDQNPNGVTFDSGTLYDVKGWHTYRLTGQAASFALYRDGQPAPIITATMAATTTANCIKLGDLNDDGAIGMDIDYVQWATDGAFPPTEPVPGQEPLAANLDFDNISDPDGPIGPQAATVWLWEEWHLVGSPATFHYMQEPGFWRHTVFAQALRIFDSDSPFDGGVRQVVDATPGWRYTLSGWFSFYNQADGTTGHTARVGIDPTGGSNLDSVWWSGPVPVGQEAGGEWQQVSIAAYAAADRITVYVRATFTPSGGAERSFFADDCVLTGAAPSTGIDDAAWCLYP